MKPEKSDFSGKLLETRTRVGTLRQRADYTTLHLGGLLPEAFAELQTTVEELQVVEEELRTQNDELIRTRAEVESERLRYQDLFDFAPDAYFVTTLDGKILEANRAASELLNIAPRFLKNRMLASSVAGDNIREFRLKMLDIVGNWTKKQTAPQIQEWELRLQRRPNLAFPAALTVVPIPAQIGEPPTLRWLARDISERKRQEEDRTRINRDQRLMTILETLSEAFVTLDHEWQFTYLNQSARRILQSASQQPESWLGKTLWDEFPAAQSTEFYTEAHRAVREQTAAEFEAFSPSLDRWLSVRLYPTPDGLAAYAEDVTERKKTQFALQAAYDRERRIAEVLQNILLRTAPPESFAALVVETFYEAASAEANVGGDFFDVFTFDKGKVALFVGDVSGKGLAAASLTAEVKYALRTIMRDAMQPAAAISRLNDFLCEAHQQGDLGSDRLVVLSLITIDPKTNEVEYLTAGGEALLMLRENGTVESLGTNGLLLGVQPGVAYQSRQTQFAPGDTILMLTDGITEARQENNFLEISGVMELATRCQSLPTLHAIGEAVMEGARAFAGGSFQDDACLLLVRLR